MTSAPTNHERASFARFFTCICSCLLIWLYDYDADIRHSQLYVKPSVWTINSQDEQDFFTQQLSQTVAQQLSQDVVTRQQLSQTVAVQSLSRRHHTTVVSRHRHTSTVVSNSLCPVTLSSSHSVVTRWEVLVVASTRGRRRPVTITRGMMTPQAQESPTNHLTFPKSTR